LYTVLIIKIFMLFGNSSEMNMSSSSGKATPAKGFFQRENASVVKKYPWTRFAGELVLLLRSVVLFLRGLDRNLAVHQYCEARIFVRLLQMRFRDGSL
jgi:hypothetical protein